MVVVENIGISIDYDLADKNHVRADARKATQIFLSGEEGTVLTIFPQALNPLLKALESLGVWTQAIVIPHSDVNNKPVYIVLKVDQGRYIDGVVMSKEE